MYGADLGSTPKIELPLAAESPIKQNDVLPPSEKPYDQISRRLIQVELN